MRRVGADAGRRDCRPAGSRTRAIRSPPPGKSIRAGLRRDCGARTFDGWLRPIALGGFDGDSGATLRLELPSQFMADWVQTHFAERLALAWQAHACPQVRQIAIGVGAGRAADRRRGRDPGAAARRGASRGRGRPLCGRAGAALPVREFRRRQGQRGRLQRRPHPRRRPTRSAFNPLFLHGGTGRGKTHLLHAIGHEFHRLQPAREDHLHVGREVHGRVPRRAARQRHASSFKQQLRSADLLMIDDVQFIAGKEFDPGRILPHDERDHLGRPALRDQLRPRAAGSGRARAAHPVAPVLGPGRRHQRAPTSSFGSTSSSRSSKRCPT